jgi:glutamate/tyrosine decarboxylase-like PLP-dependent enzyme
MRPANLNARIQEDKRAGLNPWMIVAAAGTTDTGAVDPLMAIADIAQQHKLWFHVDGAYGGAFALCEPGKKILQGIERSDSLVLDPHKGLFLPYGSGAVLIRDEHYLRKAHYYTAAYMQDEDTLTDPGGVSPADLSPELSRPFRGLRMWLPLKLAGVAAFRAALEEKMLLARYFYEKMQKLDGFVLGPHPDLSIVTFRYVPARGDADEFNRKLIGAVQRDGRIFMSSTMLDGKFTLRLAVLNVRTHRDTIDLAVEVLREKARALTSR